MISSLNLIDKHYGNVGIKVEERHDAYSMVSVNWNTLGKKWIPNARLKALNDALSQSILLRHLNENVIFQLGIHDYYP